MLGQDADVGVVRRAATTSPATRSASRSSGSLDEPIESFG
jgi:hypothetical protein